MLLIALIGVRNILASKARKIAIILMAQHQKQFLTNLMTKSRKAS
jgi:hypothetical protein